VTDTSVAQYAGLSIPSGGSVGILINNKTYTVTRYVQNNGSITAGNVWVVATFYDNAGKVVGLNYTNFLTNSFAPEAEVSFWVTPADNTDQLSSEIVNYALLIDSEPLGFSPSPSSSSTASPSSSIVQSLTLSLVIAIGIVILVIATLVLLRRRRKLSFEPPPPPMS
jgi:hypothetical protein